MTIEKSQRVGVLMGGLSREREVSLRSGQAVLKALLARGYTAVGLDVGRDVALRLAAERIEVAFIALHGRLGEDGTIQGLLEVMGLPYTGSGPLASAVAMDKALTLERVEKIGVRFPRGALFRQGEELRAFETNLPLAYPVIVKPNAEGSTIGMAIVARPADLHAAMTAALQCDPNVLVEEYIAGRELTVGLLDGRALPVLEIVPRSGFYDYQAKYTRGLTDYLCPAPLPEPVAQAVAAESERLFRWLGLAGVARADFRLNAAGESFFLEVNTIPGMTETSLVPKAAAAAGLSFADLAEAVLRTAALKVTV